MRYLKMDGPYNDYGRPNMWDKNSPIKCVVDGNVLGNTEVDPNKQVMLLIEPRSIQPNVYNEVPNIANRYKYVFTHDSKLLSTLSNAKPIIWGSVWCRYEDFNKDKLISMVSSNKEMCDLHKVRKRIARKYKDKIDVYGTIDGGEYVDPFYTLNNYKYSVVIENYIDDLWFTEKILNCFAMKVIPIYYGARDIGKYFNEWGIIRCFDIDSIEHIINKLIDNPKYADYYYKAHESAINQNYELSKKYENFEEWFYTTYEKEIKEMFK